MPPAISIATANHIVVSRMSTRLASGAISPCCKSHGGASTQPMIPPMSMLALMRRPMMIPEPTLSSERPKPTPARAENAFTTTGIVSLIHASCVARKRRPDANERADHRVRRLPRLRAARVEHDQRLAGRDAVGEGKILVLDEVLAERHRHEDAEQSGRRQPDPRLHARQLHVEPAARFGGEDVERCEQPAQKRDLSRRGAGRLNDVVLPPVVVLREQAQRQKAEERGHHRDVRPEAELEDDVRIRRADDQRDEQADGDRARRELADVSRLL